MSALGKRSLTLSIDGDDVTAEVSNAEIKSKAAESGTVTFANAAAGGTREYSLALTFIQDPAAASLWDQVWAHAGEDVVAILRPAGGTVDADHPVFTGTLTITEPDGTMLGGEASTSAVERFTTEVEWVYTAKPVRTFA
jgi:hypothetical protein